MVQVLKGEAHWMLEGRVDTDKRHKALVPVATAGQRLAMKPLRINFSKQDISTGH